VEEEGTEIMAENIQNKNFFLKISSQKEEHKHNVQQKSGVEYLDWTHMA